MAGLPHFSHPNLLVGSDNLDDAGVYQLTEEIAIIQTLDFFTPMVDDAYLFGQVAAANALSDIYAMGGKPLTAMNIAAFPTCVDSSIFARVLQGGAMKVQEAGALLIGGHTVVDNEPKYGLSICGIAHPQKIITNSGAREGDFLFITKKLGTGIINTALKNDQVTEDDIRPLLQGMAALNKDVGEVMVEMEIKGATDITGFGFLGHLHEMAAASGLSAQIWADQVPVWDRVADFAQEAMIPGGAYRNQDFLAKEVVFSDDIADWQQMIFFDPQTSGGMLISVPKEKAAAMESA
ncbi:MAG: selenide, water dikinase SelD, partial [Clostridiales bacterium]